MANQTSPDRQNMLVAILTIHSPRITGFGSHVLSRLKESHYAYFWISTPVPEQKTCFESSAKSDRTVFSTLSHRTTREYTKENGCAYTCVQLGPHVIVNPCLTGLKEQTGSIHRYFADFRYRNRLDPTRSVRSATVKHRTSETGLAVQNKPRTRWERDRCWDPEGLGRKLLTCIMPLSHICGSPGRNASQYRRRTTNYLMLVDGSTSEMLLPRQLHSCLRVDIGPSSIESRSPGLGTCQSTLTWFDPQTCRSWVCRVHRISGPVK